MAEEQNEDRARIERELMEEMQGQLLQLPVADYLLGMLQSLPSIAFMRMGLTPETKEARDLGQARLAIDAYRALLEVLASTMPGEQAGMYRSTLSQMQMAYVGALDGSGGEHEVSGPSDGGAQGETDHGDGQDGGETDARGGEGGEVDEEGGPDDE